MIYFLTYCLRKSHKKVRSIHPLSKPVRAFAIFFLLFALLNYRLHRRVELLVLVSSSFRVSSSPHISHAAAASLSLPLSTTHPSISTTCYPLFIVIIIVEIVTSSLDPICILSSLFWKRVREKKTKKRKKKKERKKSQRKKRRERKKV